MKKPKPTFDWADLDQVRAQARMDRVRQPDEFTVRDYVAKYNIGDARARCQLCALEKNGELTSRLVTTDGKERRLYKIAKRKTK